MWKRSRSEDGRGGGESGQSSYHVNIGWNGLGAAGNLTEGGLQFGVLLLKHFDPNVSGFAVGHGQQIGLLSVVFVRDVESEAVLSRWSDSMGEIQVVQYDPPSVFQFLTLVLLIAGLVLIVH